ncbi:hypothetical protein ARAM_002655 [Aspergillus rambellii]|uniref:FAD-binding domain-containing protein n=1 Tax=Aspergillus rambellii TaxID=308745 RepID=A0A0F8TWU0_9EURO|nr:hypothetical protein ARAM_002655 [Aspergillus rambellii]
MDQFKILIAGGSLVGLGLAIALERAGIDYELFEKGDFAPQLGASIGLHPHTIKILEQLGVWEDIQKVVAPLVDRHHYDENGRCFEKSRVLVVINEILQRPIIFMERSKALEILHSHIKDKSKLHARTAIVEYEDIPNGVLITTQDGKKHQGHMLIGADGIHSKVRKLMADKISVTDPSLSREINEAFTSEYNCIFAISENNPSNQFLPDAMVHNVYYDDYSAVAATGEHGLVTPNCPRFTDEDAEAQIRKYGSAGVGPGYTVKDLWDARVKAAMVPLEEGVVKQWSHNRVLLMGDAVHKATINPGLGGNLGYEGIARFTNGLVPLLKEHPMPSLEQLTAVFDQYYTSQKPRAETVVSLSGQITRYEAQDTWILRFASRYVVPWVSDRIKANLYASFSRGGPWLEYLPLPATDASQIEERAEIPHHSNGGLSILPNLTACALLVSAAAILWQRYNQTL